MNGVNVESLSPNGHAGLTGLKANKELKKVCDAPLFRTSNSG